MADAEHDQLQHTAALSLLTAADADDLRDERARLEAGHECAALAASAADAELQCALDVSAIDSA
eukprot:6830454-Prymnesium_polylepis.1